MELDFHKDKKRIADLGDSELIARIRDPAINATDRMLVEAEISRRSLDRHRPIRTKPQPELAKTGRGAKLIPIIIMIAIVGSIVAGVLEDLGIDIFEWLDDLFSGSD